MPSLRPPIKPVKRKAAPRKRTLLISATDRFRLRDTFVAPYVDKVVPWGPVGYITYKRCVTVETPILTRDLRWVPAGDIAVGTEILAFDEYGSPTATGAEGRRKFQAATITHNETETAECVEVVLSDGTTIECTPDHPWLVKKASNRLVWVQTKDLLSGGTVACHFPKYFDVWREDRSYEAGFLAAMFDGEGFLDRHRGLTFTPVDNALLAEVRTYLDQFGFSYTVTAEKAVTGRRQGFSLAISGPDQVARFLGMFRPPRLMAKYRHLADPMQLQAQEFRNKEDIQVVAVRPIGVRRIAVISTSSRTHFTAGFPSHNTYARPLADGTTEEWFQTVRRVVEGVFTIQKSWLNQRHLPWSEARARKSAEEMYHLIFTMKFLPPGRGLWAMGTEYTEKFGSAALMNCAFVSGETLEFSRPFTFLMDMSMLGVGVGFDTKAAGRFKIVEPKVSDDVLLVEDSREGWVDLVKRVLDAYVGKGTLPAVIDYSEVRPAGAPIKGFGGIAAGADPLMRAVAGIHATLRPLIRRKLTTSAVVDIQNTIGVCVVSGNVRRCLPEGTLIHTERGLVPIERMAMGDQVLASGRHGERFGEVTEVIEQGRQDLVAVRTQMGVFECTANHQVAVFDTPGTYGFKPAGDLEPGDRMVFVEDALEGRPTNLPAWHYDCPAHSTTCRDITIPELTPDVAWWLGYVAGDGYIAATRAHNGFNAHVSIPVPVDEYGDDLAQRVRAGYAAFGARTNEIAPSAQDQSRKIRSQSKQLARYLDEHFKRPNEALTVPSWILESEADIRAAFVAGLFDADGSAKTRPLNLVVSIYPDFLRQVRAVYASLGIPTRIRRSRPANDTWKALYALDLIGERARARFESSVMPHATKQIIAGRTARSQNDHGFPSSWVGGPDEGLVLGRQWARSSRQITVATYERVGGTVGNIIPVEVLEVGVGRPNVPTFDLSVAEAHEFVAEGMLVHNSAEIALGSAKDAEFLALKDPDLHPAELMSHRWASNNSVFVEVGDDYRHAASLTAKNGEPGYFWLENGRQFGRMSDPRNSKADPRVAGLNPCGEQTLESLELCCLVETFPAKHATYEEYAHTLKLAYLYAKTVTLIPTHDRDTNRVQFRNRRIGLSQSGIAQSFGRHGRRTHFEWCDKGYALVRDLDTRYSEWLTIPKSIKVTTVKPSGTVSLLNGSTPGMHYEHAEYYYRTIRISQTSALIPPLRKAGYRIEVDQYDASGFVVYFPVHAEHFDRSKDDITMWEQLENAAQMQAYWSDNACSVTVTFKPDEAKDIARALELYETRLKSVSFLPLTEHGYAQAPYITITKEEFRAASAKLKPIDLRTTDTHEIVDAYCDGDKCIVPGTEASTGEGGEVIFAPSAIQMVGPD